MNTDWLDWVGSFLAISLLISSFGLIGILVWKRRKSEN